MCNCGNEYPHSVSEKYGYSEEKGNPQYFIIPLSSITVTKIVTVRKEYNILKFLFNYVLLMSCFLFFNLYDSKNDLRCWAGNNHIGRISKIKDQVHQQ